MSPMLHKYKTKKSGPRTDPCGTPNSSPNLSELVLVESLDPSAAFS